MSNRNDERLRELPSRISESSSIKQRLRDFCNECCESELEAKI